MSYVTFIWIHLPTTLVESGRRHPVSVYFVYTQVKVCTTLNAKRPSGDKRFKSGYRKNNVCTKIMSYELSITIFMKI